jgi:biopolymer transport protein ExbD
MLQLRSRMGAGRAGNGSGEEPEINLAPLIDMVFILLIFFLVTTSFVRESGVTVERPQAATAQAQEKGSLIIGVSAGGDIHLDRRRVDLRSVRGLVERYLAGNPQGAVVIVADKASLTGRVVEVLDQARQAGAGDVAVAARRPTR